MTETFNYLSEAQLTKNSANRTLKSKAGKYMEDDKEDIKNVSKNIRDITKERAKRQISADQATAATKVWGTLLNRELTTDERKKAAETGMPFKDEKKEDKADEKIEQIVADPNKFKNINRAINEYDPKLLAETFSGDMGKMIVVILGEGVVNSKQYLERLDEIIAEKSPRMAADIKAIVAKLEADVAEQKRKEEEEEKKRFPENKIVDFKVEKAKKAWEEMFERKIKNGHKVTAEQRRLAEKAIARGEEPPAIGGGGGDGIFELFDEDKYENPVLRDIALFLQEAGVKKSITDRVIAEAEIGLRGALAKKEITREEYDQFRNDLNEKKLQAQGQREKALEVPTLSENQDKKYQARELMDSLNAKIDVITGDEDEDEFRKLQASVLSGDGILGILALKGITDPEITGRYDREWNSTFSIKDPSEFKNATKGILSAVDAAKPEKEEEKVEITGLEDAQKKGEKKGIKFNTILQQGIDEGWIEPDLLRTEPRSVIDLAKWIMVTDDARIWGPNAENGYPLFKIIDKGTREIDPNTGLPAVQHMQDGTEIPIFKEKPKVEFQSDSFIIWLRNKMIELHNDNSTDPMQPLTQVAIRTLYSPVSIIQMKYDKQRYFSDPATGEIMDDLYNEVVLEAWLFGVRRNNDLGYRQVMNSDEKLFDAIAAINAKNEHTNSTNAADYYSMADKFVRGYYEKDEKEGKREGEKRERDTRVGDGILLANAIYRNLPDLNRLQGGVEKNNEGKDVVVEGVLDNDNKIFTRKGWEDAVRILTEKGHWESVESFENLHFGEEVYFINPKTNEKNIIFDKEGKINKKGFVLYTNFFVSPTSLQSNVQVVRELVKQAVAHEMGFNNGLDYPPSKEQMEQDKAKAVEEKKSFSIKSRRNIKRVNLDFVEINSYVEQRWNGAAAKADTGYRGYDAWTKMNAQGYRERQSGEKTMGPIGNPTDIPILKNVAPDMWLALRTESNESAQEVYNKILRVQRELYKTTDPQERERLQKIRDEIMKTLRFPETTQQDWASNQVIRGAKVWHAMLGTEDLGFSKLVTRNALGVLQYGRGEFEKVVKDEFIKNRRYAFKSNNAINYGAVDRVYTGKTNEDGSPKFEERTVAESMFGHNVIYPMLEEWYSGKAEFKKWTGEGKGIKASTENSTINEYMNSDDGRNHLFKNICRAGLAAQLKSHRRYFGTGERWDNSMVINFVDSLKTLKSYTEDPKNPGKEIETGDSFFTKEDLAWILKNAGCQYWKLALSEMGGVGLDMTKMLPELFKTFFGGIVDFAA